MLLVLGCLGALWGTPAAEGANRSARSGSSSEGITFITEIGRDTSVLVLDKWERGDTTFLNQRFANGCVEKRTQVVRSVTRSTVEWAFSCPQRTEFPDGLRLHFDTPKGEPTQFSEDGTWRDADLSDGEPMFQLASRVRFPGEWEVRIPNRFQSFWSVSNQGKQALEIFPVWKENLAVPLGTKAQHRLAANDTLHRWIDIRRFPDTASEVSFSEHPDGHNSSLLFYFDDLPNRDDWNAISRVQFPKTPNSQLIHLLELHPRAKLGWVTVLDRMHWIRNAPTVTGWVFTRPWALLDTVAPMEGKRQLYVWAPAKDSLRMFSRVRAGGPARYRIHGQFQSLGAEGQAWVRIHTVKPAHTDSSATPKLVPESRSLVSTTALTFTGRHQGEFQGEVQTTGPVLLEWEFVVPALDSAILIDNFQILNDADSNLLVRGNFESSVLGTVAQNSRRNWADFHGKEHILTRAPESYKEFLRKLVRNQGAEGWEKQVYVGTHGYHHDPSFREPDPLHEFIHDDSVHLHLIMDNLLADTRKLGLYPYITGFFRTPGIQYTGRALNLFADSGFVFVDVGMNAWSRSLHLIPTYRVVRRGAQQMWGISDVWWSDGWNDSIPRQTRAVDSALVRHRTAMVGGHPEWTFLKSNTWVKFDTLLTGWETRYPGMEYLSPETWARNANSIDALRIVSQESTAGGTGQGLELQGAIRNGATVQLRCVPDSSITAKAWLNGTPIDVRQWEPGVFLAVLPDAPWGTHRVTFMTQGETVGLSPAQPKEVPVLRYDAQGRRTQAHQGVLWECRVGVKNCRGKVKLKR